MVSTMESEYGYHGTEKGNPKQREPILGIVRNANPESLKRILEENQRKKKTAGVGL